ncbi:hypothetical protein [Paenibacillus pabuli]|uniref:hypothetical protein n=1 Tax=Paenibacillus pabuli TaxID=1472 RepID=UPI001FFE629F|nr:hypothetical protein [Paenibacillus pabuli]UPK43205.1 hypothetical protein KET34_29565 [Paenibacillus pabuli]
MLEVNESKQVKLTLTDALGNKSDVTDIAEWSSSSKTIVDVNGRFIQALSAGKTSVTPKYGE